MLHTPSRPRTQFPRPCGKNAPRRAAFTLIELLIVIGIIGALIAILLPAAEHVRHQAYIAKCASNLRQIGLGISMYANENQGNYPRTTYVPGAPIVKGTGSSAIDPFGPGGPQPNDVTAAEYLLLRTEKLPPEIFLCPYNDETKYAPDPADPRTHSNFADWTNNLGYSFANPYPDAAGVQAEYRLTSHISAAFAVAADRNPGVTSRTDVTAAVPGASSRAIEKANSVNHESDGQNILYADGHVSFEATPLSGMNGDNIYTNQNNQVDAPPVNPTDSVLEPAN
jgi:prepilin-type N-terminal cleavage/methylation domain-containing protein/prepilin-type processing-associated H-X9-DG protein